MHSSSAQKAQFHIPSLDGLRAVSIAIVFLSHAGLHHVVPGLFGVTVFFFLSGYLITTLLRLECEQTGGVSLRDFYLRRTLRILPPFYVTLASIVLLVSLGLLKGTFSWPAVLAQAAQLANYHEILGDGGSPPGTEVFWSLAVEEHFYLVFPFLYLALRRFLPNPRHQFFALGVLAAAVLAWRMVLVHVLHAIPLDPAITHHPRLCHATDTRLDSILFGCMLAVWGNPVLDPPRFPPRTWLPWGFSLGVATLLFTFTQRDPAFRETFRYTLQGVALFPIFIATIRLHEYPLFRPLNWRWVRHLGALSYAIYLTHSTVILSVQQWLPSVVDLSGLARAPRLITEGVVALVLSIGTASLIHWGLEKPCARLRRKFSRVHAPNGAPAFSRLTTSNPTPPARIPTRIHHPPVATSFPGA